MAGTGTSIASIVVMGFDAPDGECRDPAFLARPRHDAVEVARRLQPIATVPLGHTAAKLVFTCAWSAVEAAAAVQRMLRLHPSRAAVRVGISAGDVTWRDGDCHGVAVAVADALHARAAGGEILVSDVVRLLVDQGVSVLRPAGSIAVDGARVGVHSVAWDDHWMNGSASNVWRGATAPIAGPQCLSERETEVLRLITTGLANRAIGERLFISRNTVANHIRAILTKTGCANRTEATMYAVRHGLVDRV